MTSDGFLRLFHHGRLAAEIPAAELAEEAPVYHRPIVPPIVPPIGAALPTSSDAAVLALRAKLAGSSPDTNSAADIDTKDFGAPRDPSANWTAGPAENLTQNFRRLLAAPNIASKRSIFEQYDHMVLTNTVVLPGAADAAVVRLKGTPRALALSTDGNGRWCALDPYIGAMHAVAEAARNVASVGARPCAATNCLNFGNPEKPEVMWQFSRAVDGIAEACRALAIPITGGNVSFYNDTLGKSIDPTPVIGVLGVLEDASHSVAAGFRSEGDLILLLNGRGPGDPAGRGLADNYSTGNFGNFGTSGDARGSSADAGNFDISDDLANAAAAAFDETTSLRLREFLSSEYARTIVFDGRIPENALAAAIPPAIDLAAEARLIETLVALATQRLVASAHDLSDGGLAVALAECAIASDGFGADADLESAGPAALSLFSETGARALVTTAESSLADVLRNAAKCGVAAHVLGRVTRGDFHLRHNGLTVIRDTIGVLHSIWSGALESAVLGSAAREHSISGESASNP